MFREIITAIYSEKHCGQCAELTVKADDDTYCTVTAGL
jgi:hypothetical protein